MRASDYLGTPKKLPAGPAVLLRLVGIGFMIWVMFYMWQCCQRGEYLRDDPVLTVVFRGWNGVRDILHLAALERAEVRELHAGAQTDPGEESLKIFAAIPIMLI